MRSKLDGTVRIVFNNVNHLGQTAESAKSMDLKEFIGRHKVDFMCMAETGVNWHRVPSKDTLWERTQHWFDDRRLAMGYNVHDTTPFRSQYGGTAILAVNTMANKIHQCGQDSTGLGRWSWMQMQGRDNHTTRIVSVYCPIMTKQSGAQGQRTVYAQHMRYFGESLMVRFWKDLGDDIDKWLGQGEKLILCGDWNTPILGDEISTFMHMKGLKEAITHKHGQDPPETYF